MARRRASGLRPPARRWQPADGATYEEAPGRHDQWQLRGFTLIETQAVPPAGRSGALGWLGGGDPARCALEKKLAPAVMLLDFP